MKNKRSKNLTSKIDFYFTILSLLNEGKNTSKISEELNISKQKIYYYTRILREIGFIEKSSYGRWIVKRSKKIDLEHALNWKDKKIRGHAFIWKIKPNIKYDWKLLLEKKKIRYNLVRGYIPRIFVKNQKVWLAKETIIVYDARSFYGKNAIQSRKYAVIGLQETIKELKRKLGINFNYFFMPTREHYGMIKNELAQQINRKGEKLIVRDDLDGEWLWVDDSNGMMGELETGGKGFTKDRAYLNMRTQNWYNDHKRTNFEVTPTFVLDSLSKTNELIKKNAQNLDYYAENMRTHISVIKKLGDAVDKLTEEVKKLKNK